MPKYELTGGLTHDGVEYSAGETVELSVEQAAKISDIVKPASGSSKARTPEATGDGSDQTGGSTAPTKTNFDKLTKAQLCEQLQARGAEFDPNATNKALVEQLEALAATDTNEPQA